MNCSTADIDSWYPSGGTDLIDRLTTAQTNARLAELALFARTVKAKGDGECRRSMAQCMVLARSLPQGALAAVLSEPEFHYWSYIAGCLRRRLENEDPIPSSDVPHLAAIPSYADWPLLFQVLDLNRFLLSASLLAGIEASVIVPVHGNEIVLPGLGIVLRVRSLVSTANLTLSFDGCAHLFVDDDEIGEFSVALTAALHKSGGFVRPELQVLPWIRTSQGAFVLNGREPYIRQSWVTSYRNADGSAYEEVPTQEYATWEKELRAAVALLAKCWPAMESDIGRALRSIVPVNSPLGGVHMSCTNDVMSFALLMSRGTPLVLAEAMIHEFAHNVLNAIGESDELFHEPTRAKADLYSPWRSDARPIAGVLHAVFVFERVCEFFLRYLKDQWSDDVACRFSLMTVRNLTGLDILRSAAERLGPAGKAVLNTLQARVQEHANRLTPGDLELVRADLLDHYDSWLTANKFPAIPTSKTIAALKTIPMGALAGAL